MRHPALAIKPRAPLACTPMLETFDDVRGALREDPQFAQFQANSPEPGIIRLVRDRVVYFLFGSEWWQSHARLEAYLQSPAMRNVRTVCLGTEEELGRLPASCRHAEIQLLGLPLPRVGLFGYLQTLHNLEQLMQTANTEKDRLQTANEQVKYVLSISRELNGVRDIPKLLTLILTQAREVTGADAGSIYVVEPSEAKPEPALHFKISQNHSMPQTLTETSLPVDENSIVGTAALHGIVINIPDIYHYSPSAGAPRAAHDSRFDKTTGYQCRSMLTVPMFDISHRVIGVIQLINRKREPGDRLQAGPDFENKILPFDGRDEEYVQIVAQQAGIALENAVLTTDIQKVFEGFVHASVTAIEQRDPTTSGHSARVAKLTCGLARQVDRVDSGLFKAVHFSFEQMKELEYASLLHDFGKLGVRESVLVKAKKLYPWQMDLLLERFELARASCEIDYLRRHLKYLLAPAVAPPGFNTGMLDAERDAKLRQLDDFLQFILKANEPTVLAHGDFDQLRDVAVVKFVDTHGNLRQLLQSDELLSLSVRRGSLTAAEFGEIKSHVTHTYNFLRKIPWGRALAKIPEIALKHHEKLDGSGYPNGILGGEIPIQSRMMTIADIYDALTAADRPYKRAVPAERAIAILDMEVKEAKLDPDLFKIFVDAQVYKNA